MFGAYMLVNFLSGKKKCETYRYKYVCVVQSMTSSGEVQVMGLKSTDKEKTVFTTNENDTFMVSQDDIINVLPAPTLVKCGRKMCYKFNKPIEVVEK